MAIIPLELGALFCYRECDVKQRRSIRGPLSFGGGARANLVKLHCSSQSFDLGQLLLRALRADFDDAALG